jgi:hypothetical protein
LIDWSIGVCRENPAEVTDAEAEDILEVECPTLPRKSRKEIFVDTFNDEYGEMPCCDKRKER